MTVLATALIAMCLGSGCRPAAAPKTQSSSGTNDTTVREAPVRGDVRIEQLLDNALSSLQPDRLGISSSLDDSVSALNDWADQAKEGGLLEIDGSSGVVPEPLQQGLSEGFLTRLQDEHFDQRDATHLRDALLFQKVLLPASGRYEGELDRVVNIFDYVVRNITLNMPAGTLPLNLYNAAMIGRGTAEHRAWLFAEILRQIPLDAFILRPHSTDASEEAWLVAVPLSDGIYLFDPRLGLPVPADAAAPKTARVRRPATLEEVRNDGKILEALSLDDAQPYPLTAEALERPRVELIITSTHAAPRNRELQKYLAGEYSVRIFEAISDVDGSAGLVSRALEAGKQNWSAEQLGIWSFPEIEQTAALNYDEAQQQTWNAYEASLMAPVAIRNIEGDNPQNLKVDVSPPQWRLRKSRNAQVLGDAGEAIRKYMSIRVWGAFPPKEISRDEQYESELASAETQEEMTSVHKHAKSVFVTTPVQERPYLTPKVPPQAMFVHVRAHEDAHFWTAASQFEKATLQSEMAEYRPAMDTLNLYFQNYARAGNWSVEAMYLFALSLIENERPAEALSVLEQIPEDHPHRWGAVVLQRRLQALSSPSSSPAEDSESE